MKSEGNQSKPMSFRLNSVARARLETFCELTGMKPSEVAKASIAQFISSTLNCNTRVLQNEAPRASNKRDIESNDSICASAHRKEEIRQYVKAFWGAIRNKHYFPRIIAAVEKHWDALVTAELSDSPQGLADAYNATCAQQMERGLTPPHPNSWIANHGFLNKPDLILRNHVDRDYT